MLQDLNLIRNEIKSSHTYENNYGPGNNFPLLRYGASATATKLKVLSLSKEAGMEKGVRRERRDNMVW